MELSGRTDADEDESGDEFLQTEEEVLEQLQELHRQLASRRSAAPGDPEDAEEAAPVRENDLLAPPKKLIICAVRKPVQLEKPFGETNFKYRTSRSGLAAAAASLERQGVQVKWVAWPGCVVEKTSHDGVRAKLEEYGIRPVFLDRDLEELFYAKFCQSVLWPLFHCIPTMASVTTTATAGNLAGARAPDQYEAYVSANQQYLEAVAQEYQEGDLVLVHDYELMLLPAMLRARFPDVACGFFCNCPFPSSEFYRMLPAREALLRGALGADLVSFNHFDYVRHFLNACVRVLGLEVAPSRLEYQGRLVTVSICPAGIAPDDMGRQCAEAAVADRAGALRRALLTGDRKAILSLDALDMSKGIPQRLLALEALLEKRPEWRGRATLVLAARDRGRKVDAQLRKAVDGLVGHVNGRFGRADYVPVHYVKRALGDDEVLALYTIADVALVASVREGINLSAMEFVACQSALQNPTNASRPAPGVLVYSEFAGCASSFRGGALVVNPYDVDGVADALHAALGMPRAARRVRHHKLARYVHTYTAALWASRLVRELRLARDRTAEHTRLLPVDVAQLRSFYERSRRRLLVFEYDGTLAPHASLAQLAAPAPPLVSALRALCRDVCNTVYVLSGRRRDDLDDWLGRECARLGMVAEGGYWVKRAPRPPPAALSTIASTTGLAANLADAQAALDASDSPEAVRERRGSLDVAEPMPLPRRASLDLLPAAPSGDQSPVSRPPSPPPDGTPRPGLSPEAATPDWGPEEECDEPREWEATNRTVDLSWRDEVLPILESFTRQTPGSALEAGPARLVWHFRDADPDFGDAQAKTLQLHLEQLVEHRPVRVQLSATKKAVLVQPARVSHGRALRDVLGDVDAYDLVLAVGDERYAEEDVFELFEGSSHSFTVTLGKRLSRAAFFLDDEEVLPTLQTLAAVSTENGFRAPAVAQMPTPNSSANTLPRAGSAPSNLGGAAAEALGTASPAAFSESGLDPGGE